ncbi:transposase [Pseudomonas chlororaphis]|uniref:hypothetical protein n=1 Tax=Pseudomonas chlororaphis TaxID=587753 RepID=UPI000789DDD8|nr:hypothetical protein [Pseudomonas chlororaphis]AMS12924.1 transposase [Pseudomonas chlororaphis]
MNISTFVERMAQYHLQDRLCIIEDLRQLATNRSLLSEHLYHDIQKNGFSIHDSVYGAYGFVLHSNDLFTLRLAFWSPTISQDECGTFIYDLNHTHDFEIYAVGYSGDGYTTVMRTILDPAPLRAGIKPLLGEERVLKLAPGHVMHMMPLCEIHKQLPPETLSASLSLIIHPQQATTTEETWCFDENYVPTYPDIATQEAALFEQAQLLLHRG